MQIEINRSNIFYSSLIIIQCIIFGFSFIVVKSLLDVGMSAFLLITVRFTIGALFLFAFSKGLNCFPKMIKKLGKNRNFKRSEFINGIIAGAVLFTGFAFQTVGAETTTPAKNGLFTDLFVIFVPIITMIYFTKKLSIKPLSLAVLAFIGVMFVINIFADNVSLAIGDLLSIFCGVAFAIHFIILEKFTIAYNERERLNPYNFTVIQLITVAVLGMIFSICMESITYSTIDWKQTLGWLIFLGVLSSAIAYLLQFWAQEKISANTTSVLSCSEAIFALIFALAFGFDEFSWLFIVGAILLITAMILSSINPTKEVIFVEGKDK